LREAIVTDESAGDFLSEMEALGLIARTGETNRKGDPGYALTPAGQEVLKFERRFRRMRRLLTEE
jgi:hypothetical protein